MRVIVRGETTLLGVRPHAHDDDEGEAEGVIRARNHPRVVHNDWTRKARGDELFFAAKDRACDVDADADAGPARARGGGGEDVEEVGQKKADPIFGSLLCLSFFCRPLKRHRPSSRRVRLEGGAEAHVEAQLLLKLLPPILVKGPNETHEKVFPVSGWRVDFHRWDLSLGVDSDAFDGSGEAETEDFRLAVTKKGDAWRGFQGGKRNEKPVL